MIVCGMLVCRFLRVVSGNFEFDQARRATRQMFSGNRESWPDAVFVANDHMAFAVMDTLRAELGLAIPDDVSIVGYDDVPAAAWPSYDLTMVRQRTEQMIKATVDILLSEIENQSAVPCQVKIDGPLVLRGQRVLRKENDMKGFDPKFRDFPDFIIGITKEIWEDRGIAIRTNITLRICICECRWDHLVATLESLQVPWAPWWNFRSPAPRRGCHLVRKRR